MLNPALNIQALASGFTQHRALSIQNFLSEDAALAAHEEFSDLPWVLQIKDYTSDARLEVPLSSVTNKDNLLDILHSTDHQLDLSQLFYMRLAVDSLQITNGALGKLTDFMNGDEFISTLQQITGRSDVNTVWLEATCFDKCCFLGAHMDDHHPGNRVAFALNLTREWKTDWGGLLMLEIQSGMQPVILPPAWNSLGIFSVPMNHTVTPVSAAANSRRYSITGWLRP